MNARLYTLAQPYYSVRTHGGAWAIVHAVPGMHGSHSIDVEGLTLEAAERECAWMNAERDAQHQRHQAEARLLGHRGCA